MSVWRRGRLASAVAERADIVVATEAEGGREGENGLVPCVHA